MGSNEEIIYGDGHGGSFEDDKDTVAWDSRLTIAHWAHRVNVGVTPVDLAKSTNDGPVYDSDRAQYLSLDRDGCNRLIKAVRKYRDAAFGKDE